MLDYSQKKWVKHVITHPFDGFEDLRWKKGGSLIISFLIIALFFFANIADSRLYGLQFHTINDKVFNIAPYLIKSVGLFSVWVIGNWSVCSLLSGEGTLKKIWIYCSYALIPYIAQIYINVLLSHFLVRDEYIFMLIIKVTGTCWTALLLFMAIKSVHQYSFIRTISAIILTIFAMLIILFLLILFLSLIQQIYVFIYSIYTEISYRLKV